MGRNTLTFAVACLFISVVAVPGFATAGEATATAAVEQIGDWELVCQPEAPASTAAAVAPNRCRLIQNHSTASNGATVLLITLLTAAADKSVVAVLSVPQDVYLAPGIELKIDGGQEFKVLYEACNPSGCHGGFKIVGDVATNLKKGSTAEVKIFGSKQTPVVVSVSLKGLSKGLERLAEVNK